jgi:hypothetical protein
MSFAIKFFSIFSINSKLLINIFYLVIIKFFYLFFVDELTEFQNHHFFQLFSLLLDFKFLKFFQVISQFNYLYYKFFNHFFLEVGYFDHFKFK